MQVLLRAQVDKTGTKFLAVLKIVLINPYTDIATGSNGRLKEIGTIKRFYSVYDVYYGLLHFIQPSVITKCGFIPKKRS